MHKLENVLKFNMNKNKVTQDKTHVLYIRQDLHKVGLLHLLAVVEKKLKLKDFVWILQII